MTTGRARDKHSYPELMAAADDERSRVRPRSDAPDGDERPAAPADAHRQRSSTPAPSLSERLEQKMLRATALLEKLPVNDPRARLLHAAVLRRDESLLDGVLSELAARPHKIG
jgi:hypothetical protein